MGTTNDGRTPPKRTGRSSTSEVVTIPPALYEYLVQWTTEQLEEYINLTNQVVEATTRKGNLAYLTKHAKQQAEKSERRARNVLKSHATFDRPISISFDDWWFVSRSEKSGVSLFLRDSLFGHLILVPTEDDDHWVVKTVAHKQMFENAYAKDRVLKENLRLVRCYLLECYAKEAQAEWEESQQDQGVFWLQNMFEAMEHENIMRLRAHLGITESPTTGKAGRPSNNAYREQVREHLDKTDNWTVIVTPF